jgi:hypothetical protein
MEGLSMSKNPMSKVINIGEIETSITQLTRIYKPSIAEADAFVKQYVRKYRIPAGYDKRLKEIVLNELIKSEK